MTGIRKRKTLSGGAASHRQLLLEREKGSYLKKWTGRLPVALIYPNTYKVGMSSLGFQLVYSLLNEEEAVVCERFFLSGSEESPRSIESARPLDHFSLIFISLSFEHDYQHLIELLLAAGIEPFAEKRGDEISVSAPLLICGGVIAFMNPEPVAPFIDLFLVGEAEPVLSDLMAALAQGLSAGIPRAELLGAINRSLPGCYAPAFYTPEYDANGWLKGYKSPDTLPKRIKKVTLAGCRRAGHSQLLTSEAEFSDLYLTELGRGCSRGCRFCTAGFIYRPPRLWDAEAVIAGLAERDESVNRVGLLGMEMADRAVLDRIAAHLSQTGCALSFSSLRADRITPTLLNLLAESHLKTVAIAPDGASERLRRVINKGLTEEDLLNAAEQLAEAGLYTLKLYLMIGLPTETDEDLQEAIDLVRKIKGRIDPVGRLRGRLCEIRISINCFAPKPWTPFQYHPFGTSERLARGAIGSAREAVSELKRRLKFLRMGLAQEANVHFSHDKAEHVLFQAILARGDRRLAPVLYEMAKHGTAWKQAMKRHDLTAEQFAVCGLDETSCFPWDIIDHGIEAGYLWQEYLRAFEGKTSAPCDTKICRRCGVCHGQ